MRPGLPWICRSAFPLPAQAQRQSLADRVSALERQAAGNQVGVDLLNQLAQLRSEVQALRAQNEELQHKLEQLEQSGKAQYLDVDSRLNRLEGGAPVAPPAAAPVASAASATAADPLAGEPDPVESAPAEPAKAARVTNAAGSKRGPGSAWNCPGAI